GHLHTNRDCDNVWTFILTDATFKSAEIQETLSKTLLHAFKEDHLISIHYMGWVSYH
ncbi:hypothetical protein ACJX0J_011265, partial [Zea mays]